MPNYIVKDDRNRFQKFDDKVESWYKDLATKNKWLFLALFPLIFVGDLLMTPIRFINNKLIQRKIKK